MGRHAIKTPPHHGTWPEYLAIWQAADEIEVFESAWNWDHFYPLAPPYDGPNLEGWTMLAALAQATKRVRLGAMVNGMHHRHPAVTANMAATPGPHLRRPLRARHGRRLELHGERRLRHRAGAAA